MSEPEITALARRLMLDIEQAVRGFSRFHKYQLGARLRDQAMNLAVLANRAWRALHGMCEQMDAEDELERPSEDEYQVAMRGAREVLTHNAQVNARAGFMARRVEPLVVPQRDEP